jgi:hypothetical protein
MEKSIKREIERNSLSKTLKNFRNNALRIKERRATVEEAFRKRI